MVMGKIKNLSIPTEEQEQLMRNALDLMTELRDPMDTINVIKAVTYMIAVIDNMPDLMRDVEQDTLCYLLLGKIKQGAEMSMREIESGLIRMAEDYEKEKAEDKHGGNRSNGTG